jgi:hypothetical protein
LKIVRNQRGEGQTEDYAGNKHGVKSVSHVDSLTRRCRCSSTVSSTNVVTVPIPDYGLLGGIHPVNPALSKTSYIHNNQRD